MNLQGSFVLRIRGLCGTGKTTLGKILAPELDAKIFEIGRYRRRGRDEVDSWERMLCDILQHLEAGGRCLVATTGLNNNEFLLDELPKNVLIWLDTDLDTLSERIRKKPFWERGYFNLFALRIYRGLGNKDQFNRRGYPIFRARMTQGLVLDASRSPTELALLAKEHLAASGFEWRAKY